MAIGIYGLGDKKDENEKKLYWNDENLRSLTAIAMGESNQGDGFENHEILMVAWVYVNRVTHDGFDVGFKGSSGYKKKGIKGDQDGLKYRAYMYALGSPKYADDKEAAEFSKQKTVQKWIAKAKQMQTLISNDINGVPGPYMVYPDVWKIKWNTDITNQGYYGDINGDHCCKEEYNKIRQYIYLVHIGQVVESKQTVFIIGRGSPYPTFLYSSDTIDKYFAAHKDKLPIGEAPKYVRETNTFQ